MGGGHSPDDFPGDPWNHRYSSEGGESAAVSQELPGRSFGSLLPAPIGYQGYNPNSALGTFLDPSGGRHGPEEFGGLQNHFWVPQLPSTLSMNYEESPTDPHGISGKKSIPTSDSTLVSNVHAYDSHSESSTPHRPPLLSPSLSTLNKEDERQSQHDPMVVDIDSPMIGVGTSRDMEGQDGPIIDCGKSSSQGYVSSALGKSKISSKSSMLQPMPTNIYKLMELRFDNQDLAVVEKVIVSREHVFRLCNDMVKGAAKAPEGRRIIDFVQLDGISRKVLGFYGSKHLMKEIFERFGIFSEVGTWRDMNTDTLSPGLYLWLKEDVAIVFYWHPGNYIPDASRKDMSCNFVRYIADLCDTVFACIEAKDLKDAFPSDVSRFSKRQRTQRLQIALVKGKEDSVKVLEGFSLHSKTLVMISENHSAPKMDDGVKYKWSEGSHRIALLASFTQPPKLSTLKYNGEIYSEKKFLARFDEWRSHFNLNLNGLSDADFLLLIETAKVKQWSEYCKLRDSQKEKKRLEQEQCYETDDLATIESETLLQHLSSFIDVCLKLEFPSEEVLFHPSGVEIVRIPPAKSLAANQDVPQNLLPSAGSSPLPQRKCHDERIGDAMRLEGELLKLLFGKKSGQRLIFPGSSVRIFLVNKAVFLKQSGKLSTEQSPAGELFTFENCVHSNSPVPLLYNTEYIIKSVGQSSDGGKFKSVKCVLRLHRDKSFDGLMSSDEEAFIEICGSKPDFLQEKNVLVKIVPESKRGLETWVRSMARSAMDQSLTRNALFLTAVLQIMNGADRKDLDNIMRHILQSKNPLEQLRPLLSVPLYQDAQKAWKDLDNWTDKIFIDISDHVQEICLTLYRSFREDLQTRVRGMVKRYCRSLLIRKVKRELSERYDKLQLDFESDMVHFIRSKKQELSTQCVPSDLQPLTVSVKSFKKVETYFPLLKQAQFRLTFNQQTLEKNRVTWKAFELVPMKEQLVEYSSRPDHILTPMLSEGKEILDLDPDAQQLLMVYFLKAGQLLVLLEDKQDKELHIFICQKLGVKLLHSNPIRTLKRGYDLISFDENTRFIAFYDASIALIKVFRFDDSFRHMDFTGADVALSDYANVSQLVWMHFVPGKKLLVLIDANHRVRVCEVNQPALVRPGNVHLGDAPFVKSIISTEGSCLLVLRERKLARGSDDLLSGNMEITHHDNDYQIITSPDETTESDLTTKKQAGELVMDVYKLDDNITHLTNVSLEMSIDDLSVCQFGIVSFASQMHLVVHNGATSSVITSRLLKIELATDICRLQKVGSPDQDLEDAQLKHGTRPGKEGKERKSGPIMDYIPQIFEKYATSPSLAADKVRNVNFVLLLWDRMDSLLPTKGTGGHLSLREKCLTYVDSSLEKLRKEKGKDFSALNLQTAAHVLTGSTDLNFIVHAITTTSVQSSGMGEWIRRLVCLVPVQIARAENNSLQPLIDGLQLSTDTAYVDAISLANVLQFGLYEAVVDAWMGDIKVVSSMGKQSSGKSYLLNHLSGSLLDVAGGRCTDGVWMTVRQVDRCLYVLLDFEGLGSFERSEQEDMLLSILNAAISNLTIFNKKDFHLDKETEAIFERFQNGVSLVKADSKLFKGLFYMAIKDVDNSDVEDLKKEFCSKILQICSKSQDNFLTKMYGGAVEISAMPFFNRPEFHESIKDIGRTVEELEASFTSGKNFLRDLKLIISQISTKDWSSIDIKRIALRVGLLKKHLSSAVSLGGILMDNFQPLFDFDTHAKIVEEHLEFAGLVFPVPDLGLELVPLKEKKHIGEILSSLMSNFTRICPRTGRNDEEWHSSLEQFIAAIVQRRKERVLEWLKVNTSDFATDGDAQKLQLEVVAMLSEVQHKMLLCSCKCQKCFLRCVQEKGHPANHSCNGGHLCKDACIYCEEEGQEILLCGDVAGHDGLHNCGEKNHTCGKVCVHMRSSSNCNGDCSQKSGHGGDHLCNSKQHNCNETCSLPSCKNICVQSIDGGCHGSEDRHSCHEKFCPLPCSIDGCNRSCAEQDHFHSQRPDIDFHFCGSSHPCVALCEHEGICEVLTEVTKETKTFEGKRATFEYELVSEQNGYRKGCCISIPPFEDGHDGPHLHSSDKNVVHFCDERCQSCGYFCTREFGHGGLHRTVHGNMRDVTFSAESEDIDILDRKYTWGESGVAEMCHMHCKAQGRGHIHLIRCPTNDQGICRKTFDGARHETCKYGPEFDVPKDELTHAAYWEYVRFEDPCSTEEKKIFSLCNHQCKSDEHAPPGGVSSAAAAAQHASYCTEPQWHEPVAKNSGQFGTGYITDDGHHFHCDHSKNVSTNVIFVVDRSGSMESSDIKPSMTKFSQSRLGCVYEAILRFIRVRLASSPILQDVMSVILFNSSGYTAVRLQDMKESVVDQLLYHKACGGTNFGSGLLEAEKILQSSLEDSSWSCKSPVLIFLSDGGNNEGREPLYLVRQMIALEPRLQVHTVMFGNDPSPQILKNMAKAGNGTFDVSLDEVQLARRFEGLARSIKSKVASLM